MGIKFTNTEGKAKKLDQYKYKDGNNFIRIFGDVLPRYVYWFKGDNNKDIPVECLDFDREQEKFTKQETNWVEKMYPGKKASWAYAINGIDLSSSPPKVVVINLKKKLFDQIKSLVEDLGDPTDLDDGWDIAFKREKTGPLAYNVEYNLQQLRCKKRSLSPEERQVIAEAKPIDEVMPRPTPQQQKEFLEKLASGGSDEEEVEETLPDEMKESVKDI